MKPLAQRGCALLLAACLVAACSGDDEGSLSPTASPWTTEKLQRDARAPHGPGDGEGRAWLESEGGAPLRAQVATTGRWTLVFEAGPQGVAQGGAVEVIFPKAVGWSPPQLVDPAALGFVTIASDAAGARLAPKILKSTGALRIGVVEGRLAPGARLRIVYGAGERGARADHSAERGERFWLLVDGDGDGGAHPLVESPSLDVEAGPPARLVAFWPTTARPGERVTLRAALLDAHDNPAAASGSLELAPLPEGVAGPRTLALSPQPGGATQAELELRSAGVYRLALRGPGGLRAVTNPLVVGEDLPRLLWGDVHGHSQISDGTGPPEDYFVYARDVAALDVSALTDHDHFGAPRFLDATPELWARIREEVRRFHAPGRFVTLLGFEWTSWLHGHRHVLYFEDDGPVVSSIDEASDTPSELWQALRGRRALTFAHHPAGGPIATNWRYAPDPELEPVVEITSIIGSSEAPDAPKPIESPVAGNYVRDVLHRYRLGFIGSKDSHDGHPGCVRAGSGQSCGLAALFSEARTREGVLEALRARRAYASNGPRMLLLATLDGSPMGAQVRAAPQAVLRGRIVAQESLDKLELVRSGRVVETIPGEGRLELVVERTLHDLVSGEYLYLRAVQVDGGAVWSSPFFVE